MGWTTADLLASVRRDARAPSSTAPGYADSDLLQLLNEELVSRLGPQVMGIRADVLNASEDQAFVAGQARYPLPARAMLGNVRRVLRVLSDGVEFPLLERPQGLLDIRDPGLLGPPREYFFDGDDIVVVPTPDASGGTLRIIHHRRPSQIVASSAVALVASASGSAVTVSTAPGSFTTGRRYDIVSAAPPFRLGEYNAVAVKTIEPPITEFAFANPLPSWVSAGDYLCLADQAPVVTLPVEFFPVLVKRTALRLLGGGQNLDVVALLRDQLAAEEAVLLTNAAPRSTGRQAAIINSVWP